MRRNLIVDAIVLKTSRIGEFHKGLILLSRCQGLLFPVLYGAYKGRSRYSGATELFCRSQISLYVNPINNRASVKEAQSTETFSELFGDWQKMTAAALLCELTIQTQVSGSLPEDSGPVFDLLLSGLRQFTKSSTEQQKRLLAQFFWRLLALLGYAPDPLVCGHCNAIVAKKAVYYSRRLGCFVCEQCAVSREWLLPPGAGRYLRFTGDRNLEAALKIGLASEALDRLAGIALLVFGDVLNIYPKSLKNIEVLKSVLP